MANQPSLSEKQTLLAILDKHMHFQSRWKIITMLAYTCSTLGMILCSTGATIFAALNYSQTAAILAASTTIFIGAEKSLLFREKWKLHLATYTALQNVHIDLKFGNLDIGQGANQIKNIMQDYAQELPVEHRDR